MRARLRYVTKSSCVLKAATEFYADICPIEQHMVGSENVNGAKGGKKRQRNWRDFRKALTKPLKDGKFSEGRRNKKIYANSFHQQASAECYLPQHKATATAATISKKYPIDTNRNVSMSLQDSFE